MKIKIISSETNHDVLIRELKAINPNLVVEYCLYDNFDGHLDDINLLILINFQPQNVNHNFCQIVNQSPVKKIWLTDDFQSHDNNSIKLAEQSGLHLNDITFLSGHNQCVARSVFLTYFGLCDVKKYDKILLDFDDTIWARSTQENWQTLSRENIHMLNEYFNDRAVIISGNTYASIEPKVLQVYPNVQNFKVDVWADANTTLYRQGQTIDFIEDLVIKNQEELINQIANDFGLEIKPCGIKPVNYKIKPLNPLERKLLVEVIKLKYQGAFKAVCTGKTTVDILNPNNEKTIIFQHCHYDRVKTLYIGDEIDHGNDKEIAQRCTSAIKVNNVAETNVILKLLIEAKK